MTKVNAEEVVAFKRANPNASVREIASKFPVGYPRIYQILIAAQIPTKHVYIYKYHCSTCGKPINQSVSGMCSECYHISKKGSVLCSYCGGHIERRISWLRSTSGRHFCNRNHMGKWLASNHGFIVHPENQKLGGRKKQVFEVIE